MYLEFTITFILLFIYICIYVYIICINETLIINSYYNNSEWIILTLIIYIFFTENISIFVLLLICQFHFFCT